VPEEQRRVIIGVRVWAVAALTFSVTLLLWLVVANALSAFVLLFTGMLFAEALRPWINKLAVRMPFGAAVALVFGVVLITFVLVTFVLFQPLGAELVKLLYSMPQYVDEFQKRLLEVQRYVRTTQGLSEVAAAIANSAGGVLSGVGTHLLGGPAMVAVFAGNTVLIVLLAVAWVLGSDDLQSFVLSLVPETERSQLRGAFSDIGQKLGSYVQGVVINGLLVGVVCGVCFSLLGVPYALLLGFIAAIFQGIPLVGAVISGPIIIFAALATSGWVKALIVTGIFVVIQLIDGNVVSPIIFGQRVQLSFLMIVFATVLGATLLGIAGAFLAVPAAAALQVFVTKMVAPAIRKATHAS